MRIFVAGATGVIGRAMLPLLLEAGHDVAGLTRTPSNVEFLRSAGALPYVCDVYDRVTLIDAVRQFRPEVVVHQLTDLPDDVAEVQTKSDDNARMRVVGTKNLIEAAQLASARKLLAQSIAFEPPRDGALRLWMNSKTPSWRRLVSYCGTADCTGEAPSILCTLRITREFMWTLRPFKRSKPSTRPMAA